MVEPISEKKPKARSELRAFVYKHYFYIFGGCTKHMTFSGCLNDTWRFNFKEKMWEEISASGE